MLIGTGVNFVAAEAESCKSETDFVYHKPEHATWPQGFALKHAAKSISTLWPRFQSASQSPVMRVSQNGAQPQRDAHRKQRANRRTVSDLVSARINAREPKWGAAPSVSGAVSCVRILRGMGFGDDGAQPQRTHWRLSLSARILWGTGLRFQFSVRILRGTGFQSAKRIVR